MELYDIGIQPDEDVSRLGRVGKKRSMIRQWREFASDPFVRIEQDFKRFCERACRLSNISVSCELCCKDI